MGFFEDFLELPQELKLLVFLAILLLGSIEILGFSIGASLLDPIINLIFGTFSFVFDWRLFVIAIFMFIAFYFLYNYSRG